MAVAPLESVCPEANVAALMSRAGHDEARRIRSDLHRRLLRDLPPEPSETGAFIDHLPNPFKTATAADRFLQHEGVAELHIPPPASWEQQREYAAARAYRAVSQAGTEALPELKVFGNGDGLSHRRRADMISQSLRSKQPIALINPIDSLDTFLAVDSDDRHASVVIVVRNLRHIAVAVAVGSALAVGNHHATHIHRNDRTWTPSHELPDVPILHGSIAAPIGTHGRTEPQTTTLFPGGNPILLSGFVLGGIEAVYQPESWPCDCAAMYIAAAAGYTIVRAVTGKTLNRPGQVQHFLINAIVNGAKVPALIAARDELAARRALTYLRRCGIA